jgi:diguanylate cyclase (GGDEF)-like protein/PAS domain S-box-containing protein
VSGAGGKPIDKWSTGSRLSGNVEKHAGALYVSLQRDRLKKVRVSKMSFEAATLAILGLSIITVIILGTLAIFGFQLIRKESGAARRARRSEEEHRAVVESSPDAILVVDLGNRITLANARAAEVFGYEAGSDMLGTNMIALVSTVDQSRASTTMKRRLALEEPTGLNVEFLMVRRDGSEFPSEVSSEVLHDDESRARGITRIVRDISERKEFEGKLIHQATHDALTGLGNRALLYDRLDYAVRLSRRTGRSGALLLTDLNRFKVINDTFGHTTGDEVLRTVAARLRTVLGDSDTVARLGGDEFAILLPHATAEEARFVGEKVLAAVADPFPVEGSELVLETSVGAALYPAHGDSTEELLRSADVAMYAAKASGDGFVLYETRIDSYDPKQMALLSDLRKAIDRDQLELHFQPKVNTATLSVDSVEALLRWHHPTRGDFPPGEFVPLAEWTGVMRPLTHWVLTAAVRQARAWRDQGNPLQVAVNVSASVLHDITLPDAIRDLLVETGVSSSLLKLEITETAVMNDPARARDVLQRLAALGVELSIDDFGTGYSSIAHLRGMPVSEIKIDSSFVQCMASDKEDASVVRSLVLLGHGLNLTVVAEGVEDAETVDILRRSRCDLMQGFYFAKPMRADALDIWLLNRSDMGVAPLEPVRGDFAVATSGT